MNSSKVVVVTGASQGIGDAIVFLDSASFITGEILHVDGGQSVGH